MVEGTGEQEKGGREGEGTGEQVKGGRERAQVSMEMRKGKVLTGWCES